MQNKRSLFELSNLQSARIPGDGCEGDKNYDATNMDAKYNARRGDKVQEREIFDRSPHNKTVGYRARIVRISTSRTHQEEVALFLF